MRSSITARRPKIFATSRKYGPVVQQSFQKAIKVTVAANNEDLRTILEKTISDHDYAKDVVDEKLKEDIMVILSTTSHGM